MTARFLLPIMMIISLVCFSACSGTRPDNLGVTSDKQLIPCPSSPNCVSTYSTTEQHKIAVYPYTGDKAQSIAKLKKVLGELPRTAIIKETDSYLHVEFTTKLMRYVDDVEFFFDDDNQSIQFRSASRLGHSDMGLNRKRMEEIRGLYGK